MVSRQSAVLMMIMAVAVAALTPVAVDAVGHKEYLEFKNIGQYIAFENKMKSQLNMPVVATNYVTGEPEPDKQATTDYSIPKFHNVKSDKRVIVEIDGKVDLTIDDRQSKKTDKTGAEVKGWKFN